MPASDQKQSFEQFNSNLTDPSNYMLSVYLQVWNRTVSLVILAIHSHLYWIW